MSEKPASKRRRARETLSGGLADQPGGLVNGRPLSLMPVPFEDQHRQRPPVQQASWWMLCTRWLQYYSIQLRWDIERSLSRLFHRRWGA